MLGIGHNLSQQVFSCSSSSLQKGVKQYQYGFGHIEYMHRLDAQRTGAPGCSRPRAAAQHTSARVHHFTTKTRRENDVAGPFCRPPQCLPCRTFQERLRALMRTPLYQDPTRRNLFYTPVQTKTITGPAGGLGLWGVGLWATTLETYINAGENEFWSRSFCASRPAASSVAAAAPSQQQLRRSSTTT